MSGGSLADQIAKLKSSGVPADKIDEYKAAFALFDTDGSGVISEAPRRHARSARCARFQAPLVTARPLRLPARPPLRRCGQARRAAERGLRPGVRRR